MGGAELCAFTQEINLSKPKPWHALTLSAVGLGDFRVLNASFGSPTLLQWAVP